MLTQVTKLTLATLLGASVLLSVGCAANKVTRLDASEEVALSDRWNAKDSELVANEMITDMLSFPWARDFEMKNKQPSDRDHFAHQQQIARTHCH